MIRNNACTCATGFERDPTSGVCLAKCQPGQYLINGVCGFCVLGTVYSPSLLTCSCPAGSYANQQGFCQQRASDCKPGFYASNEQCLPCGSGCSYCTSPTNCLGCNPPTGTSGLYISNGQCLSCAPGCLYCQSSTVCTACADTSLTLFNGVCSSRRCGNGVIEVSEGCDDGNNFNGDGCSATCQVENDFACFGRPSVCNRLVSNLCGNGLPNPGEQCDDRNNFNGDGCSSTCLVENGFTCTPATFNSPSVCSQQPVVPSSNGMVATQVIINSNNVYVILLLDTVFTFASTQEMTSFIQYQMPAQFMPASGYCRQNPNSLRNFNCLFYYPVLPQTQYAI